MPNKTLTALLLILNAGCASMQNGFHQTISIGTINDNFPELTRCKLTNEEGEWTTPPRKPLEIQRDGNPLLITCKNEEQTAKSTARPKFNTELFVADLILCPILCTAFDGIANSYYIYPTFIKISMEKNQ